MRNKISLGGDTSLGWWIAFGSIFLIYLIGANLDLMDVDATQYASISKEMQQTGEYFQLKERGGDYLDKPPLLFWFSALAFQLFGISAFVYRIFPILSSLLSAYAVYRFSKTFYNEKIGLMAALTLLSCQAYFLINHDVRTDTMLANSVMIAIWQIAEYNLKGKWTNFFWGFFCIGLAVLAKGPLGLMVPVLAFSTDFILKRQWFSFFKWQWIVGVGIVALVILPFCIGLYYQFDLHPEKTINNRTGTSGLYFYLWNHSFGRITGDDDFIVYVHKAKEAGDPFFYVHSFAWSFLPWILFYFLGVWSDLRMWVRNKFKLNKEEEALTIAGFLLPAFVISFSQYKLPHHIYVALPLTTITTAKILYDLIYTEKFNKLYRFSYGFQLFVIFLLWTLGALLSLYCFPMADVWKWLVIAGFGISICYFAFLGKNRYEKLIFPSLFAIVSVNFLLNSHVYPKLFDYQAATTIAKYARYDLKISPKRLFTYNTDENLFAYSLDFYSETYVAGGIEDANKFLDIAKKEKCWIITNPLGLEKLRALGIQTEIKILKELNRFHISTLSPEFINPATREKVLKKSYFIEFSVNP